MTGIKGYHKTFSLLSDLVHLEHSVFCNARCKVHQVEQERSQLHFDLDVDPDLVRSFFMPDPDPQPRTADPDPDQDKDTDPYPFHSTKCKAKLYFSRKFTYTVQNIENYDPYDASEKKKHVDWHCCK